MFSVLPAQFLCGKNVEDTLDKYHSYYKWYGCLQVPKELEKVMKTM